jgi:hypothetical protein
MERLLPRLIPDLGWLEEKVTGTVVAAEEAAAAGRCPSTGEGPVQVWSESVDG